MMDFFHARVLLFLLPEGRVSPSGGSPIRPKQDIILLDALGKPTFFPAALLPFRDRSSFLS